MCLNLGLNQTKSTFLKRPAYQNSDILIKVKIFSIDSFYKNLQFSVEILMEVFETVVTDKHDFKCRNTSKLVEYFGFRGLSRFQCQCPTK